MNDTIRKSIQFRARLSRQDPPTELTQSTNEETQEGEFEVVDLLTCATCHRVLHNADQVAALCGVCAEPLCDGCLDNRCDICGKILCSRDTITSFDKRKRVCSVGHGAFRRFLTFLQG